MNKVEDFGLAGLLHDIGKFAQRADVQLRESEFSQGKYNYRHAAYSAQVMHERYFDLDATLIDYSAMHHNLAATDGSSEYWIVAAADRLASGFEREVYDDYNAAAAQEDYKTQRLRHLFDDTNREYAITSLTPEAIFAQEKTAGNEYVALWKAFEEDMGRVGVLGNTHTDLATLEYLLKKHTTFIPSSTTFRKGSFAPVKANIPLYDHLKTTAVFASVLAKMAESGNENVLNYYRKAGFKENQNDFLLISGDFFGIQRFIFDDIATKYAGKILRAKSAYIQILTRIVALHVVEKLGLSELSIISTAAGKFEILATNDDATQRALMAIQETLETFFAKNFYSQSGIVIAGEPFSMEELLLGENKSGYQAVRGRLALSLEEAKHQKFALTKRAPVLDYDDTITNDTLCKLCSMRKKTQEYCEVCDTFITIGQELAKRNYLIITKGGGTPIFGQYSIILADEPKSNDQAVAIYDISKRPEFYGYAKWELGSYVCKNNQKSVVEFGELARRSVSEGRNDEGREHGVEALMVLKADVDNMGRFIQNSSVTDSFAKYNFFSRMMDYYFSVYVPHLMARSYPDTYTVFAGGDDLFVLGAWDEVIDLAKTIRTDFMRFSDGRLSLSTGMVMIKPSKPISFVSTICEEALEHAKEIDEDKDALTLFGQTVKWERYLDAKSAQKLLEELKTFETMMGSANTAFLYRLLELLEMRMNIDKDMTNAMWRSKLSYTFRRNVFERLKDEQKKEEAERFLGLLANMIENYPKESKMVLSEFIYKRRVA